MSYGNSAECCKRVLTIREDRSIIVMAGGPLSKVSERMLNTVSEAERLLLARTARDFLLFLVRWIERNLIGQ